MNHTGRTHAHSTNEQRNLLSWKKKIDRPEGFIIQLYESLLNSRSKYSCHKNNAVVSATAFLHIQRLMRTTARIYIDQSKHGEPSL